MSSHGVNVPGSCPYGAASARRAGTCAPCRCPSRRSRGTAPRVPSSRFASGPKWLKCVLPRRVGLRHPRLHLVAVVAMERIALDDRRADALAPEDVLEGPGDGGGAGAGRAGDRDDGMLGRHGGILSVSWCRVAAPNSERSLNSGEVNGDVAAVVLRVVALDALDFALRAQDHRHALVQRRRARPRGCGRARSRRRRPPARSASPSDWPRTAGAGAPAWRDPWCPSGT